MPSHSDPRRSWPSSRRRLLAWSGAATAAFVLYLVGGGRQMQLAWHIYLSGLATIGVFILAGLALNDLEAEQTPTLLSWVRSRRRRRRAPRLRSLEELERAADFSLATAFDVHYRLRPHLVQIARHRLAVRGVTLETHPDSARAMLGDALWNLVRPDREPPVNRNARGLAAPDLRALVESLERI